MGTGSYTDNFHASISSKKKADKTFFNWVDKGSGTYVATGISDLDFNVLTTSNKIYEPNKEYNISINLNGGEGVSTSMKYNLASNFYIGTPRRYGYNFTGWTGSGDGWIRPGTTGDKSYTANWSVKPSATLELDGNGSGGSKPPAIYLAKIYDGNMWKNFDVGDGSIITVYPGQQVILYDRNSRSWNWYDENDNTYQLHSIGNSYAITFTVPTNASGQATLDYGCDGRGENITVITERWSYGWIKSMVRSQIYCYYY